MGQLDAGQQALIRRMKAAAGRTVTYSRKEGGVVTSWQVVAWPGKQVFSRQPTGTDKATVVRSEADYLFAVADARAAGLELPPRRGDRITDPTVVDDVTGEAKTFELGTPTGEKEWRYSDEFQTVIRVHCKRAGN